MRLRTFAHPNPSQGEGLCLLVHQTRLCETFAKSLPKAKLGPLRAPPLPVPLASQNSSAGERSPWRLLLCFSIDLFWLKHQGL